MRDARHHQVAKMTSLELAKIEADELHPLYEAACEEIDARNRSNGKGHALDAIQEQDKFDFFY